MILCINGKTTELADEINNTTKLLTYLKIEHKIVIVEINGVIFEKEKYMSTPIMDGDRVEIVHFVGGG